MSRLQHINMFNNQQEAKDWCKEHKHVESWTTLRGALSTLHDQPFHHEQLILFSIIGANILLKLDECASLSLYAQHTTIRDANSVSFFFSVTCFIIKGTSRMIYVFCIVALIFLIRQNIRHGDQKSIVSNIHRGSTKIISWECSSWSKRKHKT
jgi:hypothetical protein